MDDLKHFPNQPSETYYGNKEYKLHLIIKKNFDHIINKKASQMLFRIIEGNGKALYIIGIKDNGDAVGIEYKKLIDSINTIKQICEKIDASIKNIRFYKGIEGYIATIRLIMNQSKYNTKFIAFE